MSTDFTGMIDFATRLADTVRQAQAATEELAAMRKAYAELQGQCASLEATLAHRQDAINDLHHSLDATKNERDAAQHKAQEVSEALAAATATLNTFRGLLGLDNGAGPHQPSKDNPPAPMASSNAGADADAADGEVRVDPTAAPGTRGVAPDAPAPVSSYHDYSEVPRYPAPMSYRDEGDPAGEPFKSDPTPAPEVAELHPTNPASTTGMITPMEDTSASEDHPKQPQERWRDSASHVAYRPFGF